MGRDLLLIAHIAGAMLFVGPTTVAASLFPSAASIDGGADAAARFHRITRTYGVAGLVVPAAGLALVDQSGFWSATWVWVALSIHVAGVGLLLGVIVPTQRRLLAADEIEPHELGRLHGVTGAHAVMWLVVLALMVLKPW